jgi:HEPN domain-containing protein
MEINVKPPKGMKTVICDNKPIGYVKDVNDPKEALKLAKDLIKSKGFWREISKSESIYNQAQSFANTSAYLYEKDLKSLPRNLQSITPFVVNAAFSAEMYLKCLQEVHGQITESHVLTALFKSLPNKVKDKINKASKKFESQYQIEKGMLFKNHLKNINNAFVDWRYIYEKNYESINIEQTIFVLQVLHEVSAIERGLKT